MIRDVDSFWQSGLDPAIQYMRSEAYNQMRESLLSMVRQEYSAILKEIYGNKKKESEKIKEELQLIREKRDTEWEMNEQRRLQSLEAKNKKELDMVKRSF